VADDLLDIAFEVALQQTVSLVQHEELALVQQAIILFYEIFEPARGAHNHLCDLVLDFSVVLLHHCPANEILDVDLLEFAYLLGEGLSLQGQFAGGYQDDALDGPDLLVDFVEDGNEVGSGFAGTVFGSGDDAFAGHDEGNGLFLDGCGDEISAFGESHDDVLV
jgi:hypothetical protein